MTDYKLISYDPTPEMVSAAEDAYMPFGDMEMAIRMALLAAPDHFAGVSNMVEGEPVAWLIDWPEEPELGYYFSNDPSEHARSRPLCLAPQPAEQQTISAYACTVPDDCETLHWRGQILSMNELVSVAQPAVDEEILVHIEGRDVLTLPLASSGMSAPRFVVHVPAQQPAEQQPAPDVAGMVQQHHLDSAELRRLCQARDDQRDGRLAALERAAKAEADVAGLVEALGRIADLPIDPCSTENDYRLSAAKAIAAGVLAAHLKQGGE